MQSISALQGERARLLQRLLELHATELSAQKQGLRGISADSALGVDAADSNMTRESRGLGAAVASISSRTVQLIEASLRRLHAGTYGRCADCGLPIASARLRALPFADACRDCQERRDQAGGAYPLLA